MAEEMKADGAGTPPAEETSVPAVQETGVKPLPPEDAGAPQDDDGSMSLIAHLTELRSRLIKCLLAVAVGSAVGYYFIGDIMHYLTLPVGKLYYMQPAAFSFFLVFPAAIMFFKGFGNDELEALFSVNRYFEFVIMFVLPFGFVFELPLVITILGKLGFITSKFLSKYARIVIFLSFVIAAVISPTPDVFTQSMIAVPMIALYGVGYLIVRFILRK